MDKQKKNEEIQSRREFFKKAAKSALPVVGAVVLASMPSDIFAMNRTGCNGCSFACSSCTGDCNGICTTSCYSACRGSCGGSCGGGCKGTSTKSYY